MPIPYRDADELTDLGIAGYLKIQPVPNETFEPKQARRLAERLDIHHSPKHGSW